MTILVVDDTEEGREIFEAVLADGGYRDVVALSSAAEAFSFLALNESLAPKRPPVDLVLLDVVMPEMDGFLACARIRSDPRYADVPILMTTSLDDLESVNHAFDSGATDYLTKPLKSVDLLARIRSVFKLKADLQKRNSREQELAQHLPLTFGPSSTW
jgi:sigma-B regulation protein RsbU (phosphoserine phosphatase)